MGFLLGGRGLGSDKGKILIFVCSFPKIIFCFFFQSLQASVSSFFFRVLEFREADNPFLELVDFLEGFGFAADIC